MYRYVITLVIAGALLAFALRSRQVEPQATPPDQPTLAVVQGEPEVSVTKLETGQRVRVRLRCAGAVSHATLAYHLNGKRQTIRQLSACEKATHGEFTDADGVSTELEIEGILPVGARDVEVLLVSETGERVAKVIMP